MLERLDVGVWDPSAMVTKHHPAVRELVELAKENKLESLKIYFEQGANSWGLSMGQEPNADTTEQ